MPISTIMLLTVLSAWTRWDSGAISPMVAATLVAASSTGMPAAIRAPKASSIRTSVTGRLKPSAADRSSPTRVLIASSMVRSPASRISSPGWARWTSAVAATRSAGSSRSAASWTAIRIAERSGFHCGPVTASTPSTDLRAERTSRAAASAEVASSVPSPRGVIRTFSASGASSPAASIMASAWPDSPIR